MPFGDRVINQPMTRRTLILFHGDRKFRKIPVDPARRPVGVLPESLGIDERFGEFQLLKESESAGRVARDSPRARPEGANHVQESESGNSAQSARSGRPGYRPRS